MEFKNLTTYKKGLIGETIVDDYLYKNNVMPYKQVFDGKELFDRLCTSFDEKKLYIVEVKTKARRTKYPDTGINFNHHTKYMDVMIKYNLDVYIYFVDEYIGKIYGNKLDLMSRSIQINNKTYPSIEQTKSGTKIIYFPIKLMEFISNLDKNIIEKLKLLSTRNYDYEDIK